MRLVHAEAVHESPHTRSQRRVVQQLVAADGRVARRRVAASWPAHPADVLVDPHIGLAVDDLHAVVHRQRSHAPIAMRRVELRLARQEGRRLAPVHSVQRACDADGPERRLVVQVAGRRPECPLDERLLGGVERQVREECKEPRGVEWVLLCAKCVDLARRLPPLRAIMPREADSPERRPADKVGGGRMLHITVPLSRRVLAHVQMVQPLDIREREPCVSECQHASRSRESIA